MQMYGGVTTMHIYIFMADEYYIYDETRGYWGVTLASFRRNVIGYFSGAGLGGCGVMDSN